MPEKKIKDPAQSKPEDWVDEKKIADPAVVKPEGYDDIPAQIDDPEVTNHPNQRTRAWKRTWTRMYLHVYIHMRVSTNVHT